MTGESKISRDLAEHFQRQASMTYGGVAPIRTDRFTNQLRVQLQALAGLIEQVNRDNGWFDTERTVGDDIALLHSEVSEAFEAWREGGLADHTDAMSHLWGAAHCERCGANREDAHRTGSLECGIAKPEGFGSEMADTLIRLLDTCSRRGVDLAGEVTRKLDYNRTRGYHHGGKKL